MKDRIAGVARVAKIARLARIADECPAPVGIGRKSCQNTESLAGIGRKSRRDTEGLAAVKKVSPEYRKSRQDASTASRLAVPAGRVNCRNASTAGRREVRIVESGVEERHAHYRQRKGESD